MISLESIARILVRIDVDASHISGTNILHEITWIAKLAIASFEFVGGGAVAFVVLEVPVAANPAVLTGLVNGANVVRLGTFGYHVVILWNGSYGGKSRGGARLVY